MFQSSQGKPEIRLYVKVMNLKMLATNLKKKK